MSEYNTIKPHVLLIAVLMLLLLSCAALRSDAQYWFQSGASGTASSAYNSGARVEIQIVKQSYNVTGSFGFWVGETLSNDAFIQVGYEIPNQTGQYQTDCTPGGCANSTLITAGTPIWFWEYFLPDNNSDSFYGSVGGSGSLGNYGTFNNYSFLYNGNKWHVFFNNIEIGNVSLGTSGSGSNPPLAVGEYADGQTNNVTMNPVPFRNLEFYNQGKFEDVPIGYSYIQYGKGSDKLLPNLYGVRDINNYADYFEVGSNLSTTADQQLWKLGYYLNISSPYGQLNNSYNHLAYSRVNISAPGYVYLSNTVREAFVGWSGTGTGSYTGRLNNASFSLEGNVHEQAMWEAQYYINVNSAYGLVSGSGWYTNGTILEYAIPSNIVPIDPNSRVVFSGWSTGVASTAASAPVEGAQRINAVWTKQYLVNATTTYGNATGSGWYGNGSVAHITLSEPELYLSNDTRYSFTGWSNGYNSSDVTFRVSAPVSMHALYKKQYLIKFIAHDTSGHEILPSHITIDKNNYTGTAFLDAGNTYTIDSVYYKGVQLSIGKNFSATLPGSLNFSAPVYNITIAARDVLGSPVNASVRLTFVNGTVMNYTIPKSSGRITIGDVPNGQAKGSINYFGITYGINTLDGIPASYLFLTPLPIILIIIGLVITILLAIRAKRSY